MCSGYYSYRAGYTPEFPGRERFGGTIVHPQAVARRPRLHRQAGRGHRLGRHGGDDRPGDGRRHRARHDAAALAHLRGQPARHRPDRRRAAPGPAREAGLRRHPVQEHPPPQVFYRKTRTAPDKVRELLLGGSARSSATTTTSTPTSPPATTRGISGCAWCPTATSSRPSAAARRRWSPTRSRRFTETGIALTSGEHLDADIIVTATGLQLVTLGEVDFGVDGEPVDFAETWTYKGLAYSDVPEPGVVVRLRQRVLDAALRPHVRLRLPPAEPHGQDRHRRGARRGCGPPTATCRPARGSTTSRRATCSA